VGDHATAEDLAQETFMRVYRARARYQPTAKFTTWVHTIANNLCSDLKQRSYRRRERGVPHAVSASSSGIGLDQLAVAASDASTATVCTGSSGAASSGFSSLSIILMSAMPRAI